MRKTLTALLCCISLCGCLGAGWPLEPAQPADLVKQVRPDTPRLTPGIWNEPCFFALIDNHLGELVTLFELPKGWFANGSVWNHHELVVRTLGLLNMNGAAAFMLIGPEERFNKAVSGITDADIIKFNSSWEKIVFGLYPQYKNQKEQEEEKLVWSEYPEDKAARLRALSSTLSAMKRGQYIKLYTLRGDGQTPQINAALICSFDMFESTARGRTSTLVRDRQVIMCFVPEGLNFQETVADAVKIGLQSEHIAEAWEDRLLEHLKEPSCNLKSDAVYGMNNLSSDITNLEAMPWTERTNSFTGERVRVPTVSSSCWVDSKGNYLFINTGNPNDCATLDKWEWRRVR